MKFKRTNGHRSGFEQKTTDLLKTNKVKAEYEPKDKKLKYTKPSTNHAYQIDYVLDNNIYVECKGRFTSTDRKKILLVKQQNPTVDLRIILQAPNQKISKISKTTYAMWCDKNNIKWGVQSDILAWSKE